MDQHQAQSVEQRGARQQQWIRVFSKSANGDVREQYESAETETVGQDVGRHVLRTRQTDVGVSGQRDDDGEHQHRELD